MPSSWWQACKDGSRLYGISPFFPAAVADVECNGWKPGRVGKFQGPMGFNRSCRIPHASMYIPEEQIKWACSRLTGDPWKALGRYNEYPDRDHYRKDVISLMGRMENQARMELYGW